MDGKRIAILGAGLVGGFIARNLAQSGDFRVTLADHDPHALKRSSRTAELETVEADLSRVAAVKEVAEPADLVVNAMPGWLGYRTLKALIETGRNVIDISFFPEDALALNPLAAAHGVTAIVDCGVMPGLGGALAHHFAAQLDAPEEMGIYVGGLPVERVWPLEYRAPFSPSDVIEEYVRPARLMEHGKVVEYEALSGVEPFDFPGIGTLEAFNTDGLRTLLITLKIPNMREKTLRYPGTADRMRMLRELGFFSEQPLAVDGLEVRPLRLTDKLLRKGWQLDAGMVEFTAMRVEVGGHGATGRVLYRCDMLEYTDTESGEFSMARTTGLPAVAAVRMFLAGALETVRSKWAVDRQGGASRGSVVPFEMIGADPEAFNTLMKHLASGGINLEFTEALN